MTPPSHRSDITNRQDIVRLVDAFYERIRKDDKLGPIFEDIAHVNWETHLPRMYDFWDSVIFRTGTFRGNPLVTHAKLGPMANMGRATFDRWLTLFRETVSELFEGTQAALIVRSAEDMANVIHSRINANTDPRFNPANLTEEQKAKYAAYRVAADSTSRA